MQASELTLHALSLNKLIGTRGCARGPLLGGRCHCDCQPFSPSGVTAPSTARLTCHHFHHPPALQHTHSLRCAIHRPRRRPVTAAAIAATALAGFPLGFVAALTRPDHPTPSTLHTPLVPSNRRCLRLPRACASSAGSGRSASSCCAAVDRAAAPCPRARAGWDTSDGRRPGRRRRLLPASASSARRMERVSHTRCRLRSVHTQRQADRQLCTPAGRPQSRSPICHSTAAHAAIHRHCRFC